MKDKMNFEGVSSVNWKDLPQSEVAPGIFKRLVWSGNQGKRAIVFEFKAGAKFPELDVHESGPEQVYVISGIFSDGRGNHPEGSFINSPLGSSHIPQSKEGCVVLVTFPEG